MQRLAFSPNNEFDELSACLVLSRGIGNNLNPFHTSDFIGAACDDDQPQPHAASFGHTQTNAHYPIKFAFLHSESFAERNTLFYSQCDLRNIHTKAHHLIQHTHSISQTPAQANRLNSPKVKHKRILMSMLFRRTLLTDSVCSGVAVTSTRMCAYLFATSRVG